MIAVCGQASLDYKIAVLPFGQDRRR